MNFSWAMDLDPKGANNQIKEVIDKQYANEDEEVVICLDSASRTPAQDNSSDSSLVRPNSHRGSSSSSSMEEEEEDDDDEDEDQQYDSSMNMDEM